MNDDMGHLIAILEMLVENSTAEEPERTEAIACLDSLAHKYRAGGAAHEPHTAAAARG